MWINQRNFPNGRWHKFTWRFRGRIKTTKNQSKEKIRLIKVSLSLCFRWKISLHFQVSSLAQIHYDYTHNLLKSTNKLSI